MKLLPLALLALLPAAQAYTLDGQEMSVTLPLEWSPGVTWADCCGAPAVVGSGVEFGGTAAIGAPQIWGFKIDAFDDKVSISWTETTREDQRGNVWGGGRPILSFVFKFTPPAIGYLEMALDSFQAGVVKDGNWRTPGVWGAPLRNGGHTFTVRFDRLLHGETYTFRVTEVPEPSTYLLMALGLGALGFLQSRKSVR